MKRFIYVLLSSLIFSSFAQAEENKEPSKPVRGCTDIKDVIEKKIDEQYNSYKKELLESLYKEIKDK